MRIAFTSNRTGVFDLYLKPSNGSGAEEPLVASPNLKIPQAWSADGRWLLFYEVNPTSGRDLWALDMTATDRPRRVVANGVPVSNEAPAAVTGTAIIVASGARK